MSLSTQPYKGARDFYPEDKRLQKWMFYNLRQVVESFGYQEYDAPIVEPIEIYMSKTSEEIVVEQTFVFTDRGGRTVTLRPEMTPSVSRMVAARHQELAYPLRWYSLANFWRYERPQHGRLREHYQLNVDLFGVEDNEAEHEIILIADTILKSFNAKPETYEIRINSRIFLDEQLNRLDLSKEQKRQCLKLLDQQAKIDPDEFQKLFNGILGEQKASNLLTVLKNQEAPETIRKLLKLLKDAGVSSASYDPSVVRGLEYYTDIVFEVFDTNPENNRAMFGGGRYDALVGAFGVEPVPTVGFGMGDVTLQNFLEGHKLLPKLATETDAVVVLIGDVYEAAQQILAKLREEGLRLAVDSSGRKVDAQIKSAVKAGVPYVLFIGEQELTSKRFKLKNLASGEEKEMSAERVVSTLASRHKHEVEL